MLNLLVLWNTVYIDDALQKLRAQGHPVREEDVARLSPFIRKHINVMALVENLPWPPTVIFVGTAALAYLAAGLPHWRGQAQENWPRPKEFIRELRRTVAPNLQLDSSTTHRTR